MCSVHTKYSKVAVDFSCVRLNKWFIYSLFTDDSHNTASRSRDDSNVVSMMVTYMRFIQSVLV